MQAADHRKVHTHLYKMKSGTTQIVEIPNLTFISAHGQGPKDVYAMHEGDALWSITRVVNRLKDMTKLDLDYKFKLMPLEMEWSAASPSIQEKSPWKAMMQVPDLITEDMFHTALLELEKRKRSVRVPLELEKQPGGTAIQTLHTGAYDHLKESKDSLLLFCRDEQHQIKNDFREIYINQPFCNPPEKLKTIVRVRIDN
ncbi:hypothetical protein HP456_10350 [Bacillus haikouensis]|uniref:hypothetical protein n=1 Tax=Bacillus haikouensis TaxID=1510468 RepID=UPI0015565615|nr:hypothetical protein [Bacillus haikouensis]NQD66319.1 hypothetical protein [Bacillus haikouensis]